MNSYQNDLALIEAKYSIYPSGLVLSLKSGKFLKPVTTQDGYCRVNIYAEGCKAFLVHRLVAMKYIANPNCYPHVNHVDGVKSHNDMKNLEWVTPSQNAYHSYQILGKRAWKEANWRLTSPEGEVFEISNLARFCKARGLNPSSLGKVAAKVFTQSAGWRAEKLDSTV